MRSHLLKFDFQDGKLFAVCECGLWQKECEVPHGQRPSEIMAELESQHEQHLNGPPAQET